jgi:hypothetical protein
VRNVRKFIFPGILILVGLAWLLSTLDVFRVDYIWTIILLFIGASILASGGFRKGSFVSGMFFIIWAVLSFLIDMEIIIDDVLFPLLIVSLGALLLINRSDLIPEKDRDKEWKNEDKKEL